MSYLDSVIMVASIEADLQVSWKTNKSRVQEYILASTNKPASGKPDRSWCGDFAYWVLKMAGVSPLPPIATAAKGGWTTVSRFGATFPKRMPGDYIAKTGDMYYMPKVRGVDGLLHETHHVGFVIDDTGGTEFDSLDGNGKGGGNWAIMTPNTIGGGYVGYATRERPLVQYFIDMPD